MTNFWSIVWKCVNFVVKSAKAIISTKINIDYVILILEKNNGLANYLWVAKKRLDNWTDHDIFLRLYSIRNKFTITFLKISSFAFEICIFGQNFHTVWLQLTYSSKYQKIGEKYTEFVFNTLTLSMTVIWRWTFG